MFKLMGEARWDGGDAPGGGRARAGSPQRGEERVSARFGARLEPLVQQPLVGSAQPSSGPSAQREERKAARPPLS